MNKKVTVGLIIVLFAIMGGAFALTKNKTSNNQSAMRNDKQMSNDDKKTNDPIMAKNETDAMNKDTTMSGHGSYITLADYNADTSKYAESTKVHFFHASWCPICQGIEKEINADMSKIPSGVTLIKTDFDSETKLRQKYGVTVQYTFVQIDNSGNQIAKWSATSLSDVIAGIKS